MNEFDTETDFREATSILVDRFETQIRPLVLMVREAVEDQIFSDSGTASVGSILQDAPTEICIQLADAWSVADLVGVSSDELLARFDPIDRFVVEMVTGIYSNSKCELFGQSQVSLFDTGHYQQPATV